MSKYSEETLAALLASAQRWKEEDPNELGAWQDCPLCHLHREVVDQATLTDYIVCFGCPIRDKTGKPACEESPYDAFSCAKDEDEAFDFARKFSRWLFDLYEEVK